MPVSDARSVRGLISSLVASALFGGLFFLSGSVGASAESVFGWRMLATGLCFLVALCSPSARRGAAGLWVRLRAHWWMPLLLCATALLVGVQMWLFAWSPRHGHGLDAATGYLLLPIVLVAVGRLAFRERVTAAQWVAVVIAAAAVAVKLVGTASFSWVTVLVCVGYAVYFGVRKGFRMEAQAVFGAEVLLLCPVGLVLVMLCDGPSSTAEFLVVLLIGFGGAVAMTAYLAASRILTMALFGLLSYAEPVLMFVVSLLLGERLTAIDIVVYALLAVALAVLSTAGFRRSVP